MAPAGGSSPIPDPIKLTLAQVKSPLSNFLESESAFPAPQWRRWSWKDASRCRQCTKIFRVCMSLVSYTSIFKVERTLPGFTWNFLRGFMERFGLKDYVDIEEMSLRLSALDSESSLCYYNWCFSSYVYISCTTFSRSREVRSWIKACTEPHPFRNIQS